MNHSSNKQTLLQALLAIQTLAIVIYTAFAITNEGLSLFQIFNNNMMSLGWNGQFNLDFSSYLTLSGLWIMWRNQFSLPFILFAFAAMIIGIMLFAPYLIYLLIVEKGDLKKVLLGAN
jgi:hypothetical protein